MDAPHRRGDTVNSAADAHWRGIFEDRYGAGAHVRLMSLFDQPCVTFAEIAC